MSVNVNYHPGDLVVVTPDRDLTSKEAYHLQQNVTEALAWHCPIILPSGCKLTLIPRSPRRYEARKAQHACYWNG